MIVQRTLFHKILLCITQKSYFNDAAAGRAIYTQKNITNNKNNMNRSNLSLLLFFILAVTLFSCKSSVVPYTQSGNWVTLSQLNGPARSEAVGFTIGNFGYLGTGWDGLNRRMSDFWKYDVVNNDWTQITSLPDSAARSSAAGTAADGMGYVGTGYDGFNYLKDFWQYDPKANTWARKADYPGGARYEAVAFGIDSYGPYIGTGFDGSNALKDFYKYNAASDTWDTVGFSGNKRYSAVTWVYNNKAYLVTGVNSGVTVNDFWVFDPSLASGNWNQLHQITNYSTETFDDSYINIVRSNAAAFVITGTNNGDRAYISTGENGALYTFTWEYDLKNDLWYEKTPFEGPATTGAVGLTILDPVTGKTRGFIATGRSGSGQAAQSDFLREFKPDEVVNPNDN